MTKIQPIGDKILVKIIEEEKNESGLVFANIENRNEPKKGKVLAVGDGVTLDTGELKPLQISVNEIVIFNPTQAIDVESDGIKCKIITIRDIYGKEVE